MERKIACITGATSGIGKATAIALAKLGYAIIATGRRQDRLENLGKELPGETELLTLCFDVREKAAVHKEFGNLPDKWRNIDILVNNAGNAHGLDPIQSGSLDDWDAMMDINVKGPFLGLRSAVPAMQKRGGGSIVITSSVAGLKGTANLSAYTTSKHAVIGLMRSAAREFAPMNIRVNTVNPSPVETRMMHSLETGIAPSCEAAVKAQMSANIPLQRYGQPDEIAKVMLFLSSDDASWVTGSVNAADGGMTS